MLKNQIYEQSFSLIVLIITLNILFEPIKCLSSELDKFGKNTVYVVNHGWHTGFVVNAYDIQEEIPELKQRFGSVPYIEFGWGDKEFYQADEITPDVTLKAIFLPTDSVLHAVAITSEADKYFKHSEVHKFCLEDLELKSLVDFISNSFYRNESGNILKLNHGIYGDSQFYKAKEDFHIFNTCNKWTAKGLESTGMKISITLKLTAGSVMSYLTKLKSKSTTGLNLSCE